MDEASRQILSDLVTPLPMEPGRPQRVDDKYERHGVRTLILFYDPIAGWRRVGCRDSRTRADWAEEVRCLLEVDYPQAETVTLVCDNLNTHSTASLYQAFDPETAGRLRRRLRLVHTPKNGFLAQHGGNGTQLALATVSRKAAIWRGRGTRFRDRQLATRSQRPPQRHKLAFTTSDARIKLKSLYPKADI